MDIPTIVDAAEQPVVVDQLDPILARAIDDERWLLIERERKSIAVRVEFERPLIAAVEAHRGVLELLGRAAFQLDAPVPRKA